MFYAFFFFLFQDEDGFEGFPACKTVSRVVNTAGEETSETPKSRGGKKSAQKVEEACTALEEAGLVTRRRLASITAEDKKLVTRSRTSSGEVSIQEVGERGKLLSVCGGRTDGDVHCVSASNNRTVKSHQQTSPTSDAGDDQCSEETLTSMVNVRRQLNQKQTNHRLGRPPTVKTTIAKKLLAKAKKKLPSLPVVGEKSPKRFILPTMSVRSSRIIKPNKRLFADITEMCSTSSSINESTEVGNSSVSVSRKRLVKLTRKGRGSHTQFLSLPRSRAQGKPPVPGMEGVGRDRMRRTISLYTESITGQSKGQVGRPPKRFLRRLEAPQQEVEPEVSESPQRCDPKESRVKEKIEKLLRSPWDDRLKQTGKVSVYAPCYCSYMWNIYSYGVKVP